MTATVLLPTGCCPPPVNRRSFAFPTCQRGDVRGAHGRHAARRHGHQRGVRRRVRVREDGDEHLPQRAPTGRRGGEHLEVHFGGESQPQVSYYGLYPRP